MEALLDNGKKGFTEQDAEFKYSIIYTRKARCEQAHCEELQCLKNKQVDRQGPRNRLSRNRCLCGDGTASYFRSET